MKKPLRVLHVEDSERDVALLTRHLSRAGYDPVYERVETPEAMRDALAAHEWDLILCDFSMPHFNAIAALAVLKKMELDIPFIIISGTVGEAVAVEAMRAGAHDYLMKDNLVRLVPTIERELHEAENRRARRLAEEAHKASEAELRALFAAMTDVILVLDAKGRYLKIAPTDPSNLYRQPDNLLGKKLRDVFPKEQADFFLKHIRRALDEGRMRRVEYSLQIDNKEIWFDGSVSPMSKDSVIWIGRDITERKQAEQLIRLQATALQSAAHAIVITDNQGAITWVNPAFTTLTGYTLEEVSGRNVRILNSGMHDRAFFKTLWDTILSGQVWRGETINRRKDGSLYFEEQSITPVMSDAGEIINFIAIKQDITEHKRADEALRDSEERYRLLFESNPHPMWVYDLETLRFLAVNKSAVRHYGYSREEFLAMVIKDIRPPEDIPLLLENVSRVRDGLDVAGVWRHLKKDGSIIDVEITTHELIFVGRRAEVVLVNDVTERKKAEEALKEAEEKYRSIFENAVEGIFQSTPEGRFISANPALVRILGYESPEELITDRTNIATQHYVNPAFRDELERMLAEQGIVVGFECEVFRKDGIKIWVEENIRAIRDESGALLYYEGSIEDMTERKMLEEQLRQSQKLEAIGQLAGGIAHDFNNLLTAINGYSDLVLRRLQAADPLRHNVEEIKKAGERAAALTRHLLAFSRKQVLQPVAIDLNTIVSDMEKMLRRLIGEDVELRTVLASELGTIKADPGQIEQVILNLAVNARDAMPQGGKLTIETENVYIDEEYATHHVAVKPGHYVMLAVSDTGTGIDEKTRAHIFEPFFTTKEVGKGTGLGLSTVYGIVKQSGGNIWVYSEVGQGTTFKVYLPRVAGGAQEYRRSVAPKEALQGKETILLAEDDEMVRNLVLEVLRHYGYQVLEASNGGAALLICERHKGQVHLLITDVVMPEMSGRELAVRLSQLRPDMKVLFMSGYTDNAIVDQGVLAEGTPFIQKPFAPDALAHKVKEVLEQQGGKRKDERRTIQEE